VHLCVPQAFGAGVKIFCALTEELIKKAKKMLS
jgi:hypothetical protein